MTLPLRNFAGKAPNALLIAAAQGLLAQQQRFATTDVDGQGDDASHLNLPPEKTLTPQEQKACFDQASAVAVHSASLPREQPLATRTLKMTSSVIRKVLGDIPNMDIPIFAGGMPPPEGFPAAALARACERILNSPDAARALQYGPTEGLLALRKLVAASLPWSVDPSQVIITTGSQQGLALLTMVLLDPGDPVLVETPTYLGALQAFQLAEPQLVGVASDEFGMLPEDLVAKAKGARLAYLQPNYQNPTGRTMDPQRRKDIADAAYRARVLIVEDNPYGDIWFDGPPPLPLAALHPENTIYLGSLSKSIAPGLRLGYAVVPDYLFEKLVFAKQAFDLNTASLNQYLAVEVMTPEFRAHHEPFIRQLYAAKRDLMLEALEREMKGLGVRWNRPAGGMFIWLRLPERLSATELQPRAREQGVVYVPGAPFYAGQADDRTLRLSFVSASEAQIAPGIAALAATVREAIEALPTALG